jgi:hypothetical protein
MPVTALTGWSACCSCCLSAAGRGHRIQALEPIDEIDVVLGLCHQPDAVGLGELFLDTDRAAFGPDRLRIDRLVVVGGIEQVAQRQIVDVHAAADEQSQIEQEATGVVGCGRREAGHSRCLGS